jgi:YidC/Oxa1 family membrane protein insertase
MNQEVRLLLAITLMMLVLVTTNILFAPPTPEESQPVTTDSTISTQNLSEVVETTKGTTPNEKAYDVNSVNRDDIQQQIQQSENLGNRLAEEIVVEGEQYRLIFNSHGARLTSAQLLKFPSFSHEGPVEFFPEGSNGALGSEIRTERENLDFRNLPFEVVPREGINLTESDQSQTLTFTYKHPSGAVTLQKSYTFNPLSYEIEARVDVHGIGRSLLVTDMGTGLAFNEAREADEARIMGYVTNHLREGIQAESMKKVKEDKTIEGPLIWAALKSKYFLLAILPGTENDQEQYLGGLLVSQAPGDHQAKVATTQPLGADGSVSYRLFVGPQERDLLMAYSNGLEEANPYGYRWMRVVVRPVVVIVMAILNFLHSNLNVGYGWVLIIFGVMMRVLLFPLNQKAMRAQMRNMAVQPLLQEIQKNHKDNPEKLQKEMMKLYKEHGFNPLAGCLPMLLPWPVLITLFFVFQNTIQLRGESFLWLPNLSAADPLYLLPVILGASMFLMQWITVRSMPDPNPQMKMMLWIMPIMMTVIFANFASGLNLYYATANIATLPQQYWIAKERQKIRAQSVPKIQVNSD